MSFGIIDVISLLLGLSGFGLQANPKAPTADQALQYALPDADIVVELDAASLIPGNYQALTQLADQPRVKASPELAKAVRQIVAEIEGPRGAAKAMTGVDFVTDVTDATAFFQLVPHHDPTFVIAVHGKFTAQTIDKIAGLTGGQPVKSGAAEYIETGDKTVGVTKDGVLIAGTSQLVKDRLADAWKAPARPKDTTLAYAADVLGGKPVFAVLVALSQAARSDVLAQLGGPNFATDVIKRHKMAAFALYHDGLGWQWVDSTKVGLEAMAQFSDGALDLMRAAQIAPRGIAKMAIGALESYRGVDKRIDEIIDHKADILKIVGSYTGDGQFKTKVDKDPTALRLSVRATGKSLSEVVPFGFIVPFGVLGVVVAKQSVTTTVPPAQIVAPPAPPSKKRP